MRERKRERGGETEIEGERMGEIDCKKYTQDTLTNTHTQTHTHTHTDTHTTHPLTQTHTDTHIHTCTHPSKAKL